MRTSISWIAAALMVSLTGCHKAETPTEVQHDVAEAREQAEKTTTEALKDQADVVAEANEEVAEEAQQAGIKKAESAADVAITRAQGEHKVALEKCDAMAGELQKACKDKADAALEMAKATARAMEAAHRQ